VGHFGPHTRQCDQVLQIVGHLASVLLVNHQRRFFDILRLLIVKANFADPLVQVGLVRLENRLH